VTLEELLPLTNADALEKLTDAELEETLRPFLPLTRPELVKASGTTKPPARQKTFEDMEKEAKIKRAKEIARALGISI
jgi:hypothetical protein